jgi:hypothetical protein
MHRESFVLHSSFPLERFETVMHETVSTDRWWREVFPVFLFAADTSPVVVKSLPGGIRLRRLHYWINNAYYPVFYASYGAEPGGTRVEGHFDLLPQARLGRGIMRVLAVVACSLFVLRTLGGLFSGQYLTFKDDPTALLVLSVFAAFGFLLPKFLSFLGRGDKPFILDFLEEQLSARLEEPKAEI